MHLNVTERTIERAEKEGKIMREPVLRWQYGQWTCTGKWTKAWGATPLVAYYRWADAIKYKNSRQEVLRRLFGEVER